MNIINAEYKEVRKIAQLIFLIFQGEMKLKSTKKEKFFDYGLEFKGLEDEDYRFSIKSQGGKVNLVSGDLRNVENIVSNMTIQPLSKSEGKSRCYHVIFKNHFVIKVPPDNLRVYNFSDYTENILHELNIAESLRKKGEKVIVAGVVGIMKRVCREVNSDTIPAAQTEKTSMEILKQNKQYEKYFILDDSYVYILDLFTYPTLNEVIKTIHSKEKIYQQEINYIHEDLAFRMNEFVDKYCKLFEGNDYGNALNLYLSIEKLTEGYHGAINDAAMENDFDSIPVDVAKEFLLKHLVFGEIPLKAVSSVFKKNNSSLDFESFVKTVKQYGEQEISDFLNNNPNEQERIKKYKKIVRAESARIVFKRNRNALTLITQNLLHKLYILYDTKIVNRDMKPDNFIVYDLTNYRLGWIDLETAVELTHKTNQPTLGGTLQYGTPSGFINNETLKSVYGDSELNHILMLQDWFSILGIIYKVVVGESLFVKTANILHSIFHAISHTIKKFPNEEQLTLKNNALSKLLKEKSNLFWQSADFEFYEKIQSKNNILKGNHINLSRKVKGMLSKELNSSLIIINNFFNYKVKQMKPELKNAGLYKAEILNNPRKLILKFKNQLERSDSNSNEEHIKRQITLLVQLERIQAKYTFFKKRKMIEEHMSIYDLLELIHRVVNSFMLKEEWQKEEEFLTIPDIDQQTVELSDTKPILE